MADAMVRSAFTTPHVTEWVEVDVTRTVELLERLRDRRELRDLRLSPLLVIARALIHAVRQQPLVNSTFDADAGEVVVKNYVNLGIAAATPRGLTVPNIKDADAMSLPELAYALDQLVRTAKDGKTAPADLAGGTITITNVGVFGVDGGTPIINPGESAILCVGAIKTKPWVHEGQVVPRQVMQLTLSFDHRHIDGETGSKVLAEVAALLEEPGLAI
jgi:pyruvate dehydrogenase E2 component (dihydrolipoamide acetyltransferase)